MIEKNNEMLEGAVRSLSDKHGTNPRDVGSISWGRFTPPLLSMSSTTVNVPSSHTEPPSSPPLPSAGSISSPNSTTPSSTPVQPTQEPSSRFFHKFCFNSSSSSISSTSAMNPNTNSRPQTPVVANDGPMITGAGISNRDTNTNTSIAGSDASDTPTTQIEDLQRDLSTLRSQLAHDKENVRKAMREKQELEGELESLSQALFEEADKMVSTERKLRAESESRLQKEQEELEEELREARAQREALRSALKVVESEIEVVGITPNPLSSRSSPEPLPSRSRSRSHSHSPARSLPLIFSTRDQVTSIFQINIHVYMSIRIYFYVTLKPIKAVERAKFEFEL
ncbi:hypothetical protein GGU11DRAFT_743757 [Lentinula aff. detonsa]|nr:hypothetical protein GGU11DRAFT_743757 [Lentinula aff. detonsa]